MDEGFAIGYASGLVDGEGTVRGYTPPAGSRSVRVINTEQSIIEAYCEALDVLGVGYTVQVRKAPASTKAVWNVAVHGRDNLERLNAVLILQSEPKRAKLQQAVDSYRRRPPVGEMRRLHKQGASTRMIGSLLGYGKSTVEYHLKRSA